MKKNNLEIKDQHKNTLVIEKQSPYQVFIKQADEDRTRMVGYLEPDQDGTFTYKKHEKEENKKRTARSKTKNKENTRGGGGGRWGRGHV